MDAQLKDWKAAADRLWSAARFDHVEATRLISDIARQSGEARLRQAAAHARCPHCAPPARRTPTHAPETWRSGASAPRATGCTRSAAR
ncbi:MAG: hypothetical protein P8Y71_07480, partial [Pseudolabrys sp.]